MSMERSHASSVLFATASREMHQLKALLAKCTPYLLLRNSGCGLRGNMCLLHFNMGYNRISLTYYKLLVAQLIAKTKAFVEQTIERMKQQFKFIICIIHMNQGKDGFQKGHFSWKIEDLIFFTLESNVYIAQQLYFQFLSSN